MQICELYYKTKFNATTKVSFFDWISRMTDHLILFLYKVKRLANKDIIISRILGYLIYAFTSFSERSNPKAYALQKFVARFKFSKELKIKSHNKINHATHIYMTRPYRVYRLLLDDGSFLDCADTHQIYVNLKNAKFLRDIKKGDRIFTVDGFRTVKKIINMRYKAYMFDLSVEEDDHSYLTNNLLSHNTTTTVAYMAWYMIFKSDKNIAIVANKGKTSTEIVTKLKQVIEGLPFFLKPGIVNLAQQSIGFDNGCYLNAVTTNPTSITGQTVSLLYLDEAAHIPENIVNEFWKSVFPTLSSFKSSQFIISSTPKGKQNLYYRLYDGSCKGKNSFINYRVDWWQVPGRDEAWEKQMRQDFGDEEFDQEFGLQFDVETSKLIKAKDFKFMEKIKKKFISHEFDGIEKKLSDLIIWHPDFHPDTLSENDLKNRKFLFVIDTAEGQDTGIRGKEDSDWNIINIFEVELMSPIRVKKNRGMFKSVKTKDILQYRQVGIYMDQNSDEEQSAMVLSWLVFNLFKCGTNDIDNCRVLIEMNFNGKNFLNKFKAHPNFYDEIVLKTYHTLPIPGQKPPQKKFGFLTRGGQKGKNYYCELGAKMISNRQIIISQNDDKYVNKSSIGELMAFGKNKKGVYEGSCVHDDISVTILFVSRVSDIEEFIWWIEDWIDNMRPDNCFKGDWNKVQQDLELIKKYQIGIDEMQEEVSDEKFNALFMPNNAVNVLYKQII